MKKEIKIPKQFNERELQIAAILASFGAKKEEMGVIELSIAYGVECWERGREEMKEEIAKNLKPLKAMILRKKIGYSLVVLMLVAVEIFFVWISSFEVLVWQFSIGAVFVVVAYLLRPE